MQAVGELDDDDTDVAAHGEEHLAEVPGLLLVHRGDLDGGELGHAVNEVGHGRPEELGELVLGRGGVLDRVVEKRRADGVLVHAQVVRQDERHLDGVVDVRLAGAATLVAMVLGGEAIGTLDLLAPLLVEIRRARRLEQAVVRRIGNPPLGVSRRRGGGSVLVGAHGSPPSPHTMIPKSGVMGRLTRARSSSGVASSAQAQNSEKARWARSPSA